MCAQPVDGEEPGQHNPESGADGHDIPHRRRQRGGHLAQSVMANCDQGIELANGLPVQDLLAFGVGLKTRELPLEGGDLGSTALVDSASMLCWPPHRLAYASLFWMTSSPKPWRYSRRAERSSGRL